MQYVYYDEAAKTVTVSPDELTDAGVSIGSLYTTNPHTMPNIKFLVHSMLANQGFRGVTGTTLRILQGPELL